MMLLGGASGECVTNGPVYLTNVVCNFNTNNGWEIYFDVAGGTNEIIYDLFSTPSLSSTSLWTWLEPAQTCETHWFTNQSQNQNFYTILTPGADRDGDGIYDGWEWKHFGNLNQTAAGDYDGDGISNGEAYTNDYSPNNLSFVLAVTNFHVRSTSVPVTVSLTTGVPASMAVLVDSTNQAAADWTSYDPNLTVNFPAVEGWHEVRVGLRGHFPENIVWQMKRIKYDVTAPLLVVTNPVMATGSQPLLQLQGYGNEPLGRVTFGLTNAAGDWTHQTGFVTFQSYSTNNLEFTTNWFQCFDLRLTNGVNTITLQIADLAGNTTATNLTFTLDGSEDTNPPAINLVWPQSGATLTEESFTVTGFLNDPSATVVVSLVGSNGVTNVFNGLVGRRGEFWVESLPLGSGTNQLYLTVTDFWGNAATTNLTVLKAGFDLTVDPLPPEQFAQFNTTITGTISDSNQDVWVNGVLATQSDGLWQAENVPLPRGATAVLQIKAVPAGSDPATTPGTAETRLVQDVPPVVEVNGYHKTGAYLNYQSIIFGAYYLENHATLTVDWTEQVGGSYLGQVHSIPFWYGEPGTPFDCNTTATLPAVRWDAGEPVSGTDSCNGSTAIYLVLGAEHTTTANAQGVTRIAAQTALKTNGKDLPGAVDTYLVKVQVADPGSGLIVPSEVLVQGRALTPSASDPNGGEVLVQAPSGATLAFTPQVAGSDNYTWSGQIEPFKLKIFLGTSTNDIAGTTNEVIVGQKISLRCELSHTNTPITSYQWTIPGFAISNYVATETASLVYSNFPTTLSNVAFYWVDGGTKQVECAVMIGGNKITAKTTFAVVRPLPTFFAEVRETVRVDTNAYFSDTRQLKGGTWLHFGIASSSTNEGIAFVYTNAPKVPDTTNTFGSYFITQVVKAFQMQFNVAQGANCTAGQAVGAGLDGSVAFYGGPSPAEHNEWADSPGVELTVARWLRTTYSFDTYLMFQPNVPEGHAVSVPMYKLSWNWDGAVLTNALIPHSWTLTSSVMPTNYQAVVTTTFPAWTNTIGNSINYVENLPCFDEN